jgi:hypothetical protein
MDMGGSRYCVVIRATTDALCAFARPQRDSDGGLYFSSWGWRSTIAHAWCMIFIVHTLSWPQLRLKMCSLVAYTFAPARTAHRQARSWALYLSVVVVLLCTWVLLRWI